MLPPLPIAKVFSPGYWMAGVTDHYASEVRVSGRPREVKEGEVISVPPNGSFSVRIFEPKNGLYWKETVRPEDPSDHYCLKTKRRYPETSNLTGLVWRVFEFETRGQKSKKPIQLTFQLMNHLDMDHEVAAEKTFRFSVG